MGYNEDMGLGWPWSKVGYSLVNLQKTMEIHHFQWVNPLSHYESPFSIAMLNYQRV